MPAVVTLPSDTSILIVREFEARRAAVWRAWTEPEFVRQWWPGRRGTATSIEMDLRVGGRWRYVMTANGGFEVAFHGECRELVPGERFVATEVFEAFPDSAALNTATFSDSAAGTTLTILVEHESRHDRDLHVGSGMEGGMNEGFDVLERLAAGLA